MGAATSGLWGEDDPAPERDMTMEEHVCECEVIVSREGTIDGSTTGGGTAEGSTADGCTTAVRTCERRRVCCGPVDGIKKRAVDLTLSGRESDYSSHGCYKAALIPTCRRFACTQCSTVMTLAGKRARL